MVSSFEGRLGDNSCEGKHGKTSILEFTKLHTVNILLALISEESKRIKIVVSGLTVALSLGNLNKNSTSAEFDEASSKEQESHRSLAYEEVVGLVRVGDIGDGVDLSWETKWESESTISSDPSKPGEHAYTSVLELGLTHPVKSWDSLRFPLRRLDESGEIFGDG